MNFDSLKQSDQSKSLLKFRSIYFIYSINTYKKKKTVLNMNLVNMEFCNMFSFSDFWCAKGSQKLLFYQLITINKLNLRQY